MSDDTPKPVSIGSTHADDGDRVAVRGTVWFRERMMLPGNAAVTVTVNDVSRADAPAVPLAEAVLSDVGAPPYPFELWVDRSAVDERATLSLRARIDVDGELWMVSDTAIPVITDGAPTEVDVLVVSARTGLR